VRSIKKKRGAYSGGYVSHTAFVAKTHILGHGSSPRWPPQSHELRAHSGHVVRKRGAVVKVMAICTPHPFIQVFKVRLLSCAPCIQISLMIVDMLACTSQLRYERSDRLRPSSQWIPALPFRCVVLPRGQRLLGGRGRWFGRACRISWRCLQSWARNKYHFRVIRILGPAV